CFWVRIKLRGDHHRDARVRSLSHFRVIHDHRNSVVLANANEAFSGNGDAPCCDASAARASPGKCTPRINPPPASALVLRKLRRLRLIIAFISVPSLVSLPNESRGGCVDTSHSGRCSPSCSRKCLYRWDLNS